MFVLVHTENVTIDEQSLNNARHYRVSQGRHVGNVNDVGRTTIPGMRVRRIPYNGRGHQDVTITRQTINGNAAPVPLAHPPSSATTYKR